jgi:hypothetical protein
MKITITYRSSKQVGPESYQEYTEVVHVLPGDTLLDAFEKTTKDWKHRSLKCDFELHYDFED